MRRPGDGELRDERIGTQLLPCVKSCRGRGCEGINHGFVGRCKGSPEAGSLGHTTQGSTAIHFCADRAGYGGCTYELKGSLHMIYEVIGPGMKVAHASLMLKGNGDGCYFPRHLFLRFKAT